MKIAYLLIVYNNSDQVFKLVRKLNTSNNSFYIHFKLGYDFIVPPDIELMTNVHFSEKRYLAGWAGFKVILANFYLMEMALKSEVEYDYYINLSGNCYPIYSNLIIEEKLSGINKSIIEGIRLPNEIFKEGGLNKIKYPWFQDEFQLFNPYLKKYLHKLIHIPYKLFNIKRKFPEKLKPYFGSQWHALTHEAVLVLQEFKTNHSDSFNFFKRCWCSDEQVIQTILYSSDKLKDKIINQPFRYIDWNTNGPPKTLIKSDFKKIIKSGHLFARKFDKDISAELIDIIDSN